VWSGWVGIAQKTGFGLVSPLPGIWPSLHVDTSIALPVGVEAYAAYALRAWLAREHWIGAGTRRFAKWSAIFSFGLGMAGQVAYHLLVQAGLTRAPWPVTTLVSCLPVLVLAMGTMLAHMLHADADASGPEIRTGGSASLRSLPWSPDQSAGDQTEPDRNHPPTAQSGPPVRRTPVPGGPVLQHRTTAPKTQRAGSDKARLVARELITAGKPVSRRRLRAAGITGSNDALNALAAELTAELSDDWDGPRAEG
jgi:hypothetical protein